ncbi:hypothetical protein N7530_011804 [Penicillium desertorum]|uniref:AttH domain-containing protein n=1 Tax=Penicillium desertorum TaxID=1303715 RepID=A0A9W9WE34_9EURO|nr:hypothetical protein N7530_011804 [Penicillium desertorum]
MYPTMLPLLLLCAPLAQQTLALPSQHSASERPLSYLLRAGRDSHSGSYQIPSAVQNGTSKARFDIPTPETTLDIETLFRLCTSDRSYQWLRVRLVTNRDDSLVLTFFSSSAEAFPFLDANETSVLNVWLWASFANGTVFADSVPATVATVTGADAAGTNSSGEWSSTGFSWAALTENLSQYEIIISSEKLQVEGRLTLTSRVPPHLPCGVQAERTILEIAPHIGWVNLIPDAVGEVDMKIHGSTLKFRGPGYHDKNWSDQPFTDSVHSWYWGHGRLGPYSIVWFSYLAIDDPTNATYVSSYVAKDGELLISACDPSILTVRPIGSPGTTGGRYPPRMGDIPDGFRLEYDLGEANGQLKVNVSVRTLVAGNGNDYMRWTGDIVGEVIESESQRTEAAGGGGPGRENSPLVGVAVLEQFIMVE